MKIGDKVFYFDRDRRRYVPGSSGNPIYRDHFRDTEIIGETPTQWISKYQGKYNKKPKSGRVPDTFSSRVDRLFTAAEVEDAVYAHDNRHKIAELVRDCQDADALRKIREILEAAK